MSAIVLDAIAADIAAITRLVDPPEGALGYGTDISCTTDIDADGREVDPMSIEAVSQSILRSLDCPQGGIYGDPEYVSLDLRARLNVGVTTADVRGLADEIRSVVTEDDRVSSADVAVALEGATTLLITISVIPEDPTRTEPFRLVIAATESSMLIEEMTTA
mgnify:CR=1 FL=1